MKAWNYALISVGLVLFMEMAGLPTGASGILDFVGLSIGDLDVSGSSLVNAITIMFASAVLGSVIIGFFTRSNPENYVVLPFITGTFILFAGTFITILQYAIGNYDPWVWGILLLLFGPFIVGFYLALVDYFRGIG